MPICGICGCYSEKFVEAIGFGGLVKKSFLDCPGERIDQDRHEALGRKRDGLSNDGLPYSMKEELVLEILRERAWFHAQANAEAASSLT